MQAQPTPVKCIPKPEATISSIRGLSLLPFKRRITRNDFWSRKLWRAPARPARPPVEQCPPVQEYLTNHERADQRWTHVPIKSDLSEANSDSSNVLHGIAHDTIKQVPIRGDALVRQPLLHNAHHDLAYSLLTDSEARLGQSLDRADHVQHHPGSSRSTVLERRFESEAEQPIQVPGVRYAQNSSFSSLPTTASKAALKPSPLRLVKEEDVVEKTPPVPLRSPLRSSYSGSNHVIGSSALESGFETNDLALTRTRSLSYTTASVYSSDDENVTSRHEKTPPSSPPPFPMRSSSLFQPPRKDAKEQAEEIREKLGIIDDIYNMYTDTDTVKKERHEALTDDIQDQVAHLSEIGRARSQKVSRTQKRVAKERTRREAAQHLVRSDSDPNTQNAEFENWLESIVHQDTAKEEAYTLSGGSHEQHYGLPMGARTDPSRRDPHPSEVPEEDEHQVIGAHQGDTASNLTVRTNVLKGKHISPSPVSHSQTSNLAPVTAKSNLDSMVSFNDLRGQLLALMEDGVEDARQEGELVLSEVTRTPSSSSSSQSSMSTEAAEDMPLNLQKIVIEWKGRRYPVLIGERGKIWEGPCFDEGCHKHRKRLSSLRNGIV